MKQILEISTREGLLVWLDCPEGPVAVQGVSLMGMEDRFASLPLAGCLFLGCPMSDALAGSLVGQRAVVIPSQWNFAFEPHRSTLYRVDELFDGFDPDEGEFGNFSESFDQRVYLEYEQHGRDDPPIDVSLARRLHDHSITDARNEFIAGRKIVGIMGGHDVMRNDPSYREIATLARSLTRADFTLASGGGPGAMEATHVGAYFAPLPDDAFAEALEILSQRRGVQDPKREYLDKDWLQRAFRVRERFPIDTPELTEGATSLSIPTWFYGHEPPAPFATDVAKYFSNSIREDGLLQIANQGIIYSPGNAGTVQEIFQDAAQNYYKTFKHASPMVLLGRDYWQTQRPAWRLLRALADTPGKEHMRDHVHLVDTIDDAENIIRAFELPQFEA